MSLEISRETEARLNVEAGRHGISVDVLLERLIEERRATARAVSATATPKLPVLHLGAMGPIHRRDIYEDAR